MIVKGFPKGGQRGVKPAMTGVALGFALIAYLVPGVSSAADPDKMGATIGSITPIKSTSTAAIHQAIGKCTLIGWTLGAQSGSRFTTSGRQRCERHHEHER